MKHFTLYCLGDLVFYSNLDMNFIVLGVPKQGQSDDGYYVDVAISSQMFESRFSMRKFNAAILSSDLVIR